MMSHPRIVITGLGVVAPNGVGIPAFAKAMEAGQSGIRYDERLTEKGFACQVSGTPPLPEKSPPILDSVTRQNFTADGVLYGLLAGLECWENAGLTPTTSDGATDWDSGCLFGAGIAGAQTLHDAFQQIDAGRGRRLRSNSTPQTMASGVSAYLGGLLGLGNRVSTNAAACSTGTEAIIEGMWHLRNGRAKRMLVGSCDSGGPYVWAGFDALRVLNRKSNDLPAAASRPLSASAGGFVPGCGAGALLLETLDSAQERDATILAEVAGGSLNSGGQRQGGSMTAPNPTGVLQCIQAALTDANTRAEEIDVVSGHLTATAFDAREVELWAQALNRSGKDFPALQAPKSLFGHCLSAAGSIESVAAVLQLTNQCLYPNLNTEDLHPEVLHIVDRERIPSKIQPTPVQTIAKASFGFGDVNSCIVLKRYVG